MKPRHYIMGLLFILLIALTSACSLQYTVRGKVIDAESKKPVAGAAVAIQWYHHKFGPPLASGYQGLAHDEALTDWKGEFAIKSLVLSPYDLCVYKKGYVCWYNKRILHPEGKTKQEAYEDRSWFWLRDGVEIELERFKDDYPRSLHASFTLNVSMDCGGGPIINKAIKYELDFIEQQDKEYRERNQK